MALWTEAIKFRLLVMPCCGQQVCWINPRWPTYCPECGHRIFPQIKENPDLCLMYDTEAQLKLHR